MATKNDKHGRRRREGLNFVDGANQLFNLTTTPTPQGFFDYQLFLVHRYNGSKQLDEYKRLLNMIQAYMDVSQPLPDIPMNEPFRDKGSATIAYDKAHNRKPDFWFSMSDEEFEQAVAKIVEKKNTELPLGEMIPIFATDADITQEI